MALLRLLLASCFAAVLLALAPAAHAIVDGEVDTTHDYVVFVGQTVLWSHPSFPSLPGLPPNARPVSGQACSGALVAPRIVVSAAHCSLISRPATVPEDAVPVGTSYIVRQGDDVIVAPGTPATFVQRSAMMNRQAGFEFGGDGLPHFAENDLGVLRLSMPLSGPYAQLPSLGAAEEIHPTEELELIGYGVSQMAGNKPVQASFDGQRRRAAARVLGNNAVADDLLHIKGDACFGDSGGPLLRGDVVLGVVSFAPSGCKSTSYVTRLDTVDSLAFLAAFGVTPS